MDNNLKSWSELTYIFERISIITRNIKSKINSNDDIEHELNIFYSSIRELNNNFINVYYSLRKNDDTTIDLTPYTKINMYSKEISNFHDFNKFLIDTKQKVEPCFEYITNSFINSTNSFELSLINSINNFTQKLNSVIDITNNM